MAKGPPKYPHPKIFGVDSYKDWLKKAQRDFARFNAAADQTERIDHIFNFSSSISQALEWAYVQVVDGKPGWTSIKDLGDFRRWFRNHCQSIGKLETVYMAAKHPRLDTFVPQIDGGSASIGGAMSAPKLIFSSPAFVAATEGATIDDVRHLVVGGVIVDTEISYTVENLYSPSGKMRFYHAAQEALKVWSQFDPAKGETQKFAP